MSFQLGQGTVPELYFTSIDDAWLWSVECEEEKGVGLVLVAEQLLDCECWRLLVTIIDVVVLAVIVSADPFTNGQAIVRFREEVFIKDMGPECVNGYGISRGSNCCCWRRCCFGVFGGMAELVVVVSNPGKVPVL